MKFLRASFASAQKLEIARDPRIEPKRRHAFRAGFVDRRVLKREGNMLCIESVFLHTDPTILFEFAELSGGVNVPSAAPSSTR
jgi:hypothetical protein